MFCIILGLIFWMKGRKKEGRIATPACAPVRNDRFFGNAVHIGSGVRGANRALPVAEEAR